MYAAAARPLAQAAEIHLKELQASLDPTESLVILGSIKAVDD